MIRLAIRKVITNANDPVTGGRRGNIHFFDSINIKRYNTGVGVTEIKAENHIWTAMVDYWENSGATANKMDIISHKGDIYLGYNNGAAVGYFHKPYIANQQTRVGRLRRRLLQLAVLARYVVGILR